jgi:hypothetical protein
MGIDIYAKWAGQTEAEEEAQYTGFDTRAGHVGYLREAYHGSPYATRALLPEAFAAQDEDGTPIPAATLRARLPTVAVVALLRAAQVYDEDDARRWLLDNVQVEPSFRQHDKSERASDKMGDFVSALARIFSEEVPASKGEQPSVPALTEQQLLAAAAAFPEVKSFVDFVDLCEIKERETGQPVAIYVSG